MAENLERKDRWNDRRGQNDRKAVANGMIAAHLYNDEARYPKSIGDTERNRNVNYITVKNSRIVFISRSLPICLALSIVKGIV